MTLLGSISVLTPVLRSSHQGLAANELSFPYLLHYIALYAHDIPGTYCDEEQEGVGSAVPAILLQLCYGRALYLHRYRGINITYSDIALLASSIPSEHLMLFLFL